ncbi:NAD(P)/FAD-dependent oxidoreductase [Salsipaludibacter albus]|uniref:NAD(P)/FAD-dependent oxidoreductase n=1 Tax=Salsipaludibacter albus TaxID=2849650 RepID=UPI001EE47BA9|nr:FAD-dependent monooxygenase [Salsipaludibacter albus]MBY5164378.1 FAD-dependent monooxygenase [Salsipaludibacter albus]
MTTMIDTPSVDRPTMPDVDVVVVGGRPAGSGTALVLARRGHRVLVLDREARGSDTRSTLALMRGGVDQLRRWGLHDRIVATGTPPITSVTFDYAGARTRVRPAAPLLAPRRTVLDATLAGAAAAGGAEVRHGVRVTGLLRDPDGTVVGVRGRHADGSDLVVRSRVVVGADGHTSLVARAVGAATTFVAPHASGGTYAFLAGVETEGFTWMYGPGASAGIIPTGGGLVCVFASTNRERFVRDLRGDLVGTFARLLSEASPATARRLARARRVGRVHGFAAEPGHLRVPHGPGWALVGDAGARVDPAAAHGITAALRDAELLGRALDVGLRPDGDLDEALAGFHRTRDTLARPLQDAAAAVAGHDLSMDDLQRTHLSLSRVLKQEAALLDAVHAGRVARVA